MKVLCTEGPFRGIRTEHVSSKTRTQQVPRIMLMMEALTENRRAYFIQMQTINALKLMEFSREKIHSIYKMSHVMRKPVFAICEQQRCKSACTSLLR